MSSRQYYVYILTNKTHTVLYTGVTNDLVRRIYEHKHNLIRSFTAKYDVHILIFYEIYLDAETAIQREKQIKGGSRKKKIELIEDKNPH